MAKKSDASMAKFSTKLENEDNVTRGLKKKRKVNVVLIFQFKLKRNFIYKFIIF